MSKKLFSCVFIFLSFPVWGYSENCGTHIAAFLKSSVSVKPVGVEVSESKSRWLIEYLGISPSDLIGLDFKEKLKLIEISIYEALKNNPRLYDDSNFFPLALNELVVLYSTYGDYDRFYTILDNIDSENARMLFLEPVFYRFTSAATISLDSSNGFLKYFLDYHPNSIFALEDLGGFYPDLDGEDYLYFLNCMYKK
ncbi:hypothetical protein [Enterovibrio baiacu]|uniref:hypothetical protein n=1 Tax=Enterovibrio baiacu TaxID=2491023 RepID=UPI001010B611|nr:hypothetical protein [Enterovibrio baiacu]MBE1273798.1 hypothetical protein [Enterovibrio baiacu]